MAGFSLVTYEYDDGEARAFFEYAGYRARRPSEPLHDAADAILRTVSEAFETEGASIGHPWAPLSGELNAGLTGYARQKLERWGFVHPILVASGELHAEATRDSATKVRYYPEGGGYVEYLVRDPKATFHQQPDGPDTGKMPHRPFFAMTAALEHEIDQAFHDWLDDIKDANRSRRRLDSINPVRL